MIKMNRSPKKGTIQAVLQTLNAKFWFISRVNYYYDPA